MVSLLLLAALAAVVAISYLYLKWSFSYWKRRGFPSLEPHYFYGNFEKEIKNGTAMGDMLTRFYNYAKSKGYKHMGIYMFFARIYLLVDLELIKNILHRDFNYFLNHGVWVVNEDIDPLSAHLFNLDDDKWRALRVKLTPTFTSGKIKMMFHTLVNCTKGLEDTLKLQSKIQDPIDIKDIVSRFTTDIIGSCAFGIECNSFKEENSDFLYYGKKFFEPSRLQSTLMFYLPKRVQRLINLKSVPDDVTDFFMNIVKKTVDYREKNNIARKDFMHLLLQLKNKGRVTDDDSIATEIGGKGTMSMDELAAQCFVFFAAGFETSATTMTFASLELAQNPDIQDKLREDIVTTLKKHNGELTYEAVMDMTYLNKVVYETMRKHPPGPTVPRICTKDYVVPGTDLVIEKGTRTSIPVQAIHHDPEYYPDPERFDPERFSEENKAKRPAYSYLPFGEGPRICIGARFGLMQYETKSVINCVKGGVWLNVSEI